MHEQVLPSDMGYFPETVDSIKNKIKSVAREEFSEETPLCAGCDAELDDYESCYCQACEKSIT